MHLRKTTTKREGCAPSCDLAFEFLQFFQSLLYLT